MIATNIQIQEAPCEFFLVAAVQVFPLTVSCIAGLIESQSPSKIRQEVLDRWGWEYHQGDLLDAADMAKQAWLRNVTGGLGRFSDKEWVVVHAHDGRADPLYDSTLAQLENVHPEYSPVAAICI